MKHTPLSRCAASPRSRPVSQCGQGDAASVVGRPLRGCARLGRAGFMRCDWRLANGVVEQLT